MFLKKFADILSAVRSFPKTSIGSSLISKKALIAGLLLLISAFISAVFVSRPLKAQRWLSEIYNRPLQKTLQTAEGHLIEKKGLIRVLKIKRGDKILLEFLAKQADDSYRHINSVQLKGQREAYYDYWGEMTSLQILDDNGDGTLDVIAPSFDQFLRPRINLVSYDKISGKFKLKPSLGRPKVVSPQFRTKN